VRSTNLVDAEIKGDSVSFGGFDVKLPPSSPLVGANRKVILGIRPTDFDHVDPASDLPRIQVHIDVVEDLGAENHLIFAIDAPRVTAEAVRAAADTADDADGTLFADDRAVFTAVVGAKRATTPGSDIELAIDNTRLHFFDPATGLVAGAGEPVAAPA
jgi:multiple sugar transport system ATP-binding protein